MAEYTINGGFALQGEVEISGAKNVVLPAIAAALLTDEEVRLENVPLIADLSLMLEMAKGLGVEVNLKNDHTLTLSAARIKNRPIPLDIAAKLRTSFLMLVPLLTRFGEAEIPNPGGCRIGARPIERSIEALCQLGAKITYESTDGYFHAVVSKFQGKTFKFAKNTHTGTEMVILAAVLAAGITILENAAAEPEVDDLVNLLNKMGAKIRRTEPRKIVIEGVKKLKGTNYKIMSDRNEAVTFAIAALVTRGHVLVKGASPQNLKIFLEKLTEIGAGWEPQEQGIKFYYQKPLKSAHVVSSPHPGFMTDWQAPWAVLMTQAEGEAIIHETVYESRFQYVEQLIKMGAKISFFNPPVPNRETFYNFNPEDDRPGNFHAIKVTGPTTLHNAVLSIPDLRAGATLVLGALVARGESILLGVEHIDRGYENFESRLTKIGAKIQRRE